MSSVFGEISRRVNDLIGLRSRPLPFVEIAEKLTRADLIRFILELKTLLIGEDCYLEELPDSVLALLVAYRNILVHISVTKQTFHIKNSPIVCRVTLLHPFRDGARTESTHCVDETSIDVWVLCHLLNGCRILNSNPLCLGSDEISREYERYSSGLTTFLTSHPMPLHTWWTENRRYPERHRLPGLLWML